MGSCDCSIDAGLDGDTARVYYARTRRARVPHVCDECREMIPAGAEYEEATGLWDGGWWERYRTCAPCVAMRRDLCPNGWVHGALGEQIHDCLGFNPYAVPEDEP